MRGVIEKKLKKTAQRLRLSTLEEWRVHAPPQGRDKQWKCGRSAKESARSWLAAAPWIPAEIAKTLRSHHDFGTFRDWCAEPEAKVRFDKFRGEPANVDVLLVGRDKTGPIVVAVEAKADELFGQTVNETLSAARLRLENKPQSKGVERIEQLCEMLFGAKPNQTEILELRYQLLTLTAAAIAKAERKSAKRAVVMIHEFKTPLTTDKKHDSNANDLNDFVVKISGQPNPLNPGTLLGPFKVPGEPIVKAEISLYFGKAVVNKR